MPIKRKKASIALDEEDLPPAIKYATTPSATKRKSVDVPFVAKSKKHVQESAPGVQTATKIKTIVEKLPPTPRITISQEPFSPVEKFSQEGIDANLLSYEPDDDDPSDDEDSEEEPLFSQIGDALAIRLSRDLSIDEIDTTVAVFKTWAENIGVNLDCHSKDHSLVFSRLIREPPDRMKALTRVSAQPIEIPPELEEEMKHSEGWVDYMLDLTKKGVKVSGLISKASMTFKLAQKEEAGVRTLLESVPELDRSDISAKEVALLITKFRKNFSTFSKLYNFDDSELL